MGHMAMEIIFFHALWIIRKKSDIFFHPMGEAIYFYPPPVESKPVQIWRG
jgi:hypothetical protein